MTGAPDPGTAVERAAARQEGSSRDRPETGVRAMTLRIAIVGAGDVGGTLRVAWANRAHEVFVGVRDAADPTLEELLARPSGKARTASVKEAWPALRSSR
jgi:hypothetical protein